MTRVMSLALVLASIGVASSPARAASIAFAPASQSALAGDQVDVDLVISGLGDLTSPSLSTFDLDVAFDPTVLSFDAAQYGDPVLGDQLDLLGLGFPLTTTTVGIGSVNLFELSFNTDLELDTLQAGLFILATLTFDALAVGTSPLIVTINALGDSVGDPLVATVSGGSVTVVPVTAVPEPTPFLFLASGLVACWSRRRKQARAPN